MASYTILYWQDIPAVVEASDGETTKKIQLSERFQVLIDAVAMRKNLVGTDAYIEEWNRGRKQTRDGAAEAVAQAVAAELEAGYHGIKATALADSRGAAGFRREDQYPGKE